MALAFDAGLRLAHMELVQFHPTGMLWPEDVAGTLVTEAVRGEGGRLTNADGERFMQRYDPERLELSTRDRVAFANYTEIVEGRGGPHGGVFLDVSHLPKATILEKLPRMYRQFVEYEMLDISREPMEVAPTAHYSMGGVVVDPETTATDVDGLFAAGEVTSGVHGANRLGGNSLAEVLVFGRLAGEHAARLAVSRDASIHPRRVIEEAADEVDRSIRKGDELARSMQRAVRDVMWRFCGVVRDAEGLDRGLAEVDAIADTGRNVDVSPNEEGWADLGHLFDLRAALLTARATLLGASAREESRGALSKHGATATAPRCSPPCRSRMFRTDCGRRCKRRRRSSAARACWTEDRSAVLCPGGSPNTILLFAYRLTFAWGTKDASRRAPLKGALIPIVALTRGFPLAPFGWSGTRGPFP
jgi:succinate dehydrogenase / fumarate reductase flavoprotein subunit